MARNKKGSVSELVNALAYFGERGKALLITRFREHKKRGKDAEVTWFELTVEQFHGMTEKHPRTFGFVLGEYELVEISSRKRVYQFPYARRPGMKKLTIFIPSPDELCLCC